MHKTRTLHLTSRLFSAAVLVSLLLVGFKTGDSTVALAQEAANQRGIQPLTADGSSFYYYADGERVSLTPSLDWVSVKFVSENPIQQLAALTGSGAPLDASQKALHIPNPELTLLAVQPGVTVNTLVQGINSMRAMPASFQTVNPVFQTADAEMAITDEFIATFPAEKSLTSIDAINASHGVEIVESILGQPNTFILKVPPDSRLNSLAMANLYQESGAAIDAAPNFVRILRPDPQEGSAAKTSAPGPMSATNDYWYFDQWALNNTQQYGSDMTYDADIDAPEAWDITTGSPSVTIAIIDEGVELTQEDLIAKLVPGYDATGGGSGGAPCTAPCGNEDDAHGTNVAGLAAASSNNSIGIAGVCQGCLIMPVRIAYGFYGFWITYDSWIANGITWAYLNGASILSNSWGGGSASSVINTAIMNAKTYGRGGKGSVVVFAAGNSNAPYVSYPASLSTVMAVAASNMCDLRKKPAFDLCNGGEYWGSNYGTALDISAPGVWLDSTDRMGYAGYSSGNYFRFMNGTSGATPIVSGVAGLVLSVNPNLTAGEVQTILQNSADDVNGGGWDSAMGYGRVNAQRAVMVAASTSAAYRSTGAYDGWVLESTEISNRGATKNASGSMFNLGDDISNKQYRAILSFDTSGAPLPPGAAITSVSLQIKKARLVGANPFAKLGKIVVDIRMGAFNDNAALQSSDFQGLASQKAVFSIGNNPSGSWYSGALSPSYFSYINPAGLTQFRLRFSKDDNNNSLANYLKFYSGDYLTIPAYQPTLVITYYITP